ncbi:MAG: MFS transporter [Opitutaceae bacterium]|jgi:ACS family hexuronate transporter-like MFS transporter|nr:MFS transporter [Opitutaceae bacterium]
MKPEKLRWLIAVLVLFAMVLNYIDRGVVGILKTEIMDAFGMDNAGFGNLQALFTACYALSYVGAGWLVDRFGAGRMIFISILSWSAVCAGGALARTLGVFATLRGALGIVEPVIFPGQLRIVTNWFPASLRATANSICACGGTVGMVVAPFIVGWLATERHAWLPEQWHGWRAAFIVPGALGVLVAIVWFFVWREPPEEILAASLASDNKAGAAARGAAPARETPAPRGRADGAAPPAQDALPSSAGLDGSRGRLPPAGGPPALPEPASAFRWNQVWATRSFWGIVLSRVISDPVWFFCLFWLPGYLREQSGLTLAHYKWFGGIPYLVAALGGIATSALSDRWVRRGLAPLASRKRLLVMLACLAPLCALAPFMQGPAPAIVIFSLIGLMCLSWLFSLGVVVAETFPNANVGSVWGISGAFGAAGGTVFNVLAGKFLDPAGPPAILIAMAFLHPLATALLLALVRRERPAA